MKKQLAIFIESKDIAENKFFKVIDYFYNTCLQYANKWKSSLGNTEKLKWIFLKTPQWKEIHDSINKEILICTQVEEAHVFDQWVLIKEGYNNKRSKLIMERRKSFCV